MQKLSITLKQHTPLIHFQHYEDGATLRATEVKPKLDRFIWEKWEKEEGGKEQAYNKYCKFLIGYPNPNLKEKFDSGFRALDYKMIFQNSGQNVHPIRGQYPCFFGNMGVANDEEKKFLAFFDRIEATLKSFTIDIEKTILKYLTEFFILHNFGTRTSKGFGGFVTESTSQTDFENQLKIKFKTVYRKGLPNSRDYDFKRDHEKLFKEIEKEYKWLKSGIPRKEESKLREYFNDQTPSVEWEKVAIKAKVNGEEPNVLNSIIEEDNVQYIRALLGLAENFEYSQNNIKAEVKPLDNEFQRYQSPIFVKVFNNNIYFCTNSVHQHLIEGKAINFKFKYKDNDIGNLPTPLLIPKSFNLDDFLKTALNNSWTKL